MSARTSPRRSFRKASALVEARVRKAAESRGFSVSRVLTNWSDVVGVEVARVCEPVDVRYGKAGLGATLTICTTGAQAPILEMQKEAIRTRVNAAYGYAAVRQIRITQTAATGFAEEPASYSPPLKEPAEPPAEFRRQTVGISDPDLKSALENLAANVTSRTRDSK